MTTQTKKIGVAIIGTSGIGKQHASALVQIKDAELVGVWGSDPLRTRNFAAQFGIKAYSSLEELLADKMVDIVDVVGIHNQHAFFGVQAAKKGKHVIVEKPLDATIEAARRLVEECRRNNVYLATVFQHRYDMAIKSLKDAVDNGKLGKIFMARTLICKPRTEDYYDSSGGWRGKRELSGGGVLINQAIHLVDSLVFLFGEAASVCGEMETFSHDVEIEDIGIGVIRFKNNVLATIQATTTGQSVQESLEVYGTLGSARIEEETLTFFGGKESRLARLMHRATGKLRRYSPFVFSAKKKLKPGYHKENLEKIIKAVKERKKPPVGFEEGLKSLEIVESIIKSAETKKLVEIRPTAKKTFGRGFFRFLLSEAGKLKPKVLIVNPLNKSKSNEMFSHIGQNRLRQPLGLAYVSSFLKKITDVQFVDAAILGWDGDKTASYIDLVNPEVLIISSGPLDRWQNPDLDISSIFNIINKVRTKNKIIVGAHGSVTPDWIFENCKANFVVRGEPEMTCLELVKNLLGGGDFKEIAGLSWRNHNKIIHNKDRIFDSNLDEYPFPDYESLPMHLYRYTTPDLPEPFSLILASRGCPGQCVFCLKKMMPDKYRARSAENILSEMKYLHENFAVRSFYFQDWEFLINKERVKELCRLLIETADLNICWGCSARASSLDEEVIHLMKKAGCVLINFGFESGSQEILNKSKKGVSLEKVKEVVRLCREEDINIRPFCLVNLPGETKKTLKESARFITENNLEIPHINIPIPYPGTKLAESIKGNSWKTALSQSGRVGTTIEPENARKLLRKYIWRGKFGITYFLNPKFWRYSFEILMRKFL